MQSVIFSDFGSIAYHLSVKCPVFHSNDHRSVCRLKCLLNDILALYLFDNNTLLFLCVKSTFLCPFDFVACLSVSSFVKKTTEKINNLQMSSDLWPRPDHRDGGQGAFALSVTSCTDEVDNE